MQLTYKSSLCVCVCSLDFFVCFSSLPSPVSCAHLLNWTTHESDLFSPTNQPLTQDLELAKKNFWWLWQCWRCGNTPRWRGLRTVSNVSNVLDSQLSAWCAPALRVRHAKFLGEVTKAPPSPHSHSICVCSDVVNKPVPYPLKPDKNGRNYILQVTFQTLLSVQLEVL